jgi:hypothetical protein
LFHYLSQRILPCGISPYQADTILESAPEFRTCERHAPGEL